MPFEPVLPKGAHLGTSQKVAGAVSGNAYASGKNLGPVAWRLVEPLKDEVAPNASRLVPLALMAVVGLAVGVAGTKAAQQLKGSHAAEPSQESTSAAPAAGWYETVADPSRLRYWDGAAWTDHVMPRASTTTAAADWYPDPSSAAQLRYWDGVAWTQHVAPRQGAVTTPPGWYPDPSNAAQLRYWDGVAWTQHLAAHPGAPAIAQSSAASSTGTSVVSAPTHSRSRMSAADWQAHVRAWMSAGAIEQELWTRLANADIADADPATLAAQRELGQLTPEQCAHRIRLMIEANPGLREQLSELMKLIGGGRPQSRQMIQRTGESPRPLDGRR